VVTRARDSNLTARHLPLRLAVSASRPHRREQNATRGERFDAAAASWMVSTSVTACLVWFPTDVPPEIP
jgi:hypothetical protein